ncbi:MAG: PD40 domain-containing protein [Ardenticatenaceae bacterium]|nr:PD40 domain-containing protein [Ardenticatenaceae bacterium]
MNKRITLMVGLIFLLSLLSVLFVSCTNQSKQPTSLLLFNQRTEESSEIYSMYPDGSHITQITELPAYSPYWLSPDGTKLAYLTGKKLAIIDTLTGKAVAEIEDVGSTVSEHFVDGVAWSPEGDKLVFVSDSAGKQGTDIWLYDLSTGLRSPLTDDEAIDLEPAWSSDTQNIAFVTHKACDGSVWNCPPEQEYWDIAKVNLATSTRQTITDFRSSGLLPSGNRWYALLCNLSWSSDDKYISFENACSQPDLQWWKQVFVAPTDGSNLFQLTHFSEYDPAATQFPISIFLYSTQWVPPGNTLLISYTEAELTENGKRTDGFFLVSENEFPIPGIQSELNILGSTTEWSPNGEYVIGNTTSVLGFPLERPFIGQLNNNKVTLLSPPQSLPYGSCRDNTTYWSPDSQYVAYAANKQGNICTHAPLEDQNIAVIAVSDTDVIGNVITLGGDNRPIGWLTSP